MTKGYIVIQDWMLDLPLSLVETAIYAIIYGFSQDGESAFCGSLSYIAKKSKVSKDTARRGLHSLVEKGYIQKMEVYKNGVLFNDYRACSLQGGIAICKGGTSNLLPHNKDIYKDMDICSNKKRAAFVKPTLSQVETYCLERGNNIDPQAFIDFYESNGWKVGKNAMKDWKAAVRTWESRNTTRSKAQPVRKQSNLERLNAMAAEIMGDMI